MYRSHVLVCGGTGCTSSGSQQIMETLKEEIKKAGLEKEVSVVQTGCHGLCALGPIMIVYPDASFYSMVKVEDIPEIVQEHLLKDVSLPVFFTRRPLPRPASRLLSTPTSTRSSTASHFATAVSSTRKSLKSTSEPAATLPSVRFSPR